MSYLNDHINRNIVLIVFLILYAYLSYVSNKLKRSKNWKGVKCNPIEIVVGSILEPQNSSSVFEKCMQFSISEDQEKRIQEYSSNVDSHMQKKINELTSGLSNDSRATNIMLGKTDKEINNLKTENIDNEITMNEFKTNIQQLTYKVNTAFDTFRDSSNNLLSKLEI